MSRIETLEKAVRELQDTVDLLLEVSFHQGKIHGELVNKIKDLNRKEGDKYKGSE